MDPKTKNATQPFVYHTNKAVTKARERDFPSLFEAFCVMSHALASVVDHIFIVFTNVYRHVECNCVTDNHTLFIFCRFLLVPSFPFIPVSICEASTKYTKEIVLYLQCIPKYHSNQVLTEL